MAEEVNELNNEAHEGVVLDTDNPVYVEQVNIMQEALGLLYQANLEYPVRFNSQQIYEIVRDFVLERYMQLRIQMEETREP